MIKIRPHAFETNSSSSDYYYDDDYYDDYRYLELECIEYWYFTFDGLEQLNDAQCENFYELLDGCDEKDICALFYNVTDDADFTRESENIIKLTNELICYGITVDDGYNFIAIDDMRNTFFELDDQEVQNLIDALNNKFAEDVNMEAYEYSKPIILKSIQAEVDVNVLKEQIRDNSYTNTKSAYLQDAIYKHDGRICTKTRKEIKYTE